MSLRIARVRSYTKPRYNEILNCRTHVKCQFKSLVEKEVDEVFK